MLLYYHKLSAKKKKPWELIEFIFVAQILSWNTVNLLVYLVKVEEWWTFYFWWWLRSTILSTLEKTTTILEWTNISTQIQLVEITSSVEGMRFLSLFTGWPFTLIFTMKICSFVRCYHILYTTDVKHLKVNISKKCLNFYAQ